MPNTARTCAVDDIVLTVTNDGSVYETCKELARMPPHLSHVKARGWMSLVIAFETKRVHAGSPRATDVDLFNAALELSEYYDAHVREIDAEAVA